MRRTTILSGTMHPGTPMYMAPERSSITTILDTRADIFALGATLWEGLTNDDYKPLLVRQKTLDVREYNPLVSRVLAMVLSKMVQHEAIQRYQTAHELRGDLGLVRRGKTLELLAANSNRSYQDPPGYAEPQGRYIHRGSMRPLVFGISLVLFFCIGQYLLFTVPVPEAPAPQAGPASVEEAQKLLGRTRSC
ncbi:MAG: hypothetical protein GFH27_549293n205 [Chloroflexi bacterium AL-W]|nr:hypothetical protein [Chloroflexi bacterium AL-N1]NOK67680.1 hypothetical protein [Chloroflexi bacterium AL-N10]NOK75550.1 hypothetical protein [Chloroflexi bacterium AL-N5]NOK82338.1 hypothetical protein [Chloroflexi bacterium AL-W]NOK90183.1 hypothetical protein [Chloroflexi bacterium AL-N15]